MKWKILLIISLFFILQKCQLTDDELDDGWWKYGSGYYSGDLFDFKHNHLRGDTIFYGASARGIIIDREESIFGWTSRKVFIKSLDSDKVGIYHQK